MAHKPFLNGAGRRLGRLPTQCLGTYRHVDAREAGKTQTASIPNGVPIHGELLVGAT